MNLSGNTILITGGASGIGFGLAKRFSEAGSNVIVCGRRQSQLDEAKQLCPALHALQADVSTEDGCRALAQQVTAKFPALNVLINNAGTQNRLPPLTQPQEWSEHARELAINLHAPMLLSMLLIPHLATQKSPVIANVSSGLAFAPAAFIPTYCATKAALHSFTQSLRAQLSKTPIQVVEIIPPMVNTDLGGKGLHDQGASLDGFCDHTMKHLAAGDVEFGYETSETRRLASREQLDSWFAAMNK